MIIHGQGETIDKSLEKMDGAKEHLGRSKRILGKLEISLACDKALKVFACGLCLILILFLVFYLVFGR